MRMLERRQKGLSLIEMLIALVIGAIVIAGVYQTFTAQQKSFLAQEQVSEAQQSARAVMDIIARDIRMAGFGMPGWVAAGVANSITINQGAPADFTIVGVFSSPIGKLSNAATMGQNQIVLDRSVDLTQGDWLLIFESDRPVPGILTAAQTLGTPLMYHTVVVAAATGTYPAGSNILIDSDGSTPSPWTPASPDNLDKTFRANALVYRVGTVHYQLNGNNIERNGSVLATHVTDFQIADQFNPGPPAVPETFGRYQIQLTVETRTNDPDFPGGVRTRSLTSTIRARNLFLSS